MNFFAEQILTHRLWKTYGWQMRQVAGWRDALRVWEGHAVKFGCNDCCTPINVIKFINKKKKPTPPQKKQKKILLGFWLGLYWIYRFICGAMTYPPLFQSLNSLNTILACKEFITNRCWILPSSFSTLFCDCDQITFVGFLMLDKVYISGINPTWSWSSIL